MREIEILFRVDEPKESVVRKLQHLHHAGAKRIVDIYFTHPRIQKLHPVNFEIFSSFRIRQAGGKTLLTWKDNHMQDGKYLYADEEEVEVESFEKIMAVLAALGFTELVRVENERMTFTTPEYEMVLDDVKGLGVLMEIEHRCPEERDAAEVQEEMRQFLKTLGISIAEELHMGKPELLLQKQQA